MNKIIVCILLFGAMATNGASVWAQEFWVNSIITSDEWKAFPCEDYYITNVCWTSKDFNDPGYLPKIISIGDTIRYTDKEGKERTFIVRHIEIYVFEKDVETTLSGKKYTAKKGDTQCTLYDVRSRRKTHDSYSPSRIIINNCLPA